MLYLLRIIFSFFILLSFPAWVSHAQGEGDAAEAIELSRNVVSALKKGRAEAKKMTLPVNEHAEEGLKAAKETAKIFHSSKFQNKVQHETQRLKEEIGECTASLKKLKKGESEKHVFGLSNTEKVYLFLSSSIPDETVHNYLVDIARVGDPGLIPVMRGMVNGLADRKGNTKYFSRILKEDLGCRDKALKPCQRFKTGIHFQPPLFKKYGINRVPALIYDNGDQVFLIQGDAGLDYFLERINREEKQESLKSLITRIRGENK